MLWLSEPGRINETCVCYAICCSHDTEEQKRRLYRKLIRAINIEVIHSEQFLVLETQELRYFENKAGMHSNKGGMDVDDMVDEKNILLSYKVKLNT
jgi:hypothetical protein